MPDPTKSHPLRVVKQEDDMNSDLEATEEQAISVAISTLAVPENRGASTLRSPHEHVQRVIEQPTYRVPNIPFDEKQASLTSYPPGCPVLHVNASAIPPVVTIGQTQSVAFNMAARELQFCIIPAHGGEAIVASESQLQYAPRCPVEATVNDDTGPTTRQASVLTSYQPSPTSVALYSVQEDGACGSIFHGIPKESIKYRPNVAAGIVPPAATAIAAVAAATTNVSGTSSPSDGLTKTGQSQGAFSYLGHSDQSASNQYAQEVDDAMSISFGINSPAKRSIVKARKVSPDVPAKRRKSNEGVSIVSPSENEGMNREVYTPRESQSGGRDASPEPSKRKQSPTAKRESSDDVSPVTATSMTSHTWKGDHLDKCTTACTKFIIPSCSFRVVAIKEFFAENGDTIMRETNCRICFKTQLQSASRGNNLWHMHLEVDGAPDDVYRAIITIERLLVRTLCYEEQGRALYYMALLNKHRHKNTHNKVVRQFCCHLNKEDMKYMYVKRLPRNYEEIIGICIGKSGSRKKRIEKGGMQNRYQHE
jgi:hypothetical protein